MPGSPVPDGKPSPDGKRSPGGRRRSPLMVLVVALLVLGCIAAGGFALNALGLLPWIGDNPPIEDAPPPNEVLPIPDDHEAQPEGPGPGDGPEGTPTGEPELPEGMYRAIPLPEEMRAMWISFQELSPLDFSSEASLRGEIGALFEDCKNLGLNTVIVMVRPYSDALYPSAIFPFSHIMNGYQGYDPGFDPLAAMIDEAHARGLRFKAWIIPYKIRDSWSGPAYFSSDHPAILHPDWTIEVNGALWYNPGLPEVRKLVCDGVAEIVQNYAVDGIHFDDYFYPSSDEGPNSFDAYSFALYGGGMPLAQWRRENNDNLVRSVYECVKAANPTVSFGISPSGDNWENYYELYADVEHWMAQAGFVDYLMPQLYWGFAYRTYGGSSFYAFGNLVDTWALYPCDPSVRLYAGLGAYRIGLLQWDGSRYGFGDYGNNDQSEWSSGHNLADMVLALREQEAFSGFSLFRHAYLFQGSDWVSESECSALRELLQ
ncbi:MAG: family 10 glycosylhydrolase [Eggerthellaceae bacterium]|nr:family 10 glycosylhydrolase [Eggerthellaceae bacterium]